MAFDPITAVSDFAGKVVDKIFPDKTEAAKAKAALDLTALQQEFQAIIGQQEINKVEAAHESIFVAGWRPFIGWVCGSALAYYYVAQPFLVWIFDLLGYSTSMPALETGELMTILLGMLGLGAFRSYDKTKGNGSKG